MNGEDIIIRVNELIAEKATLEIKKNKDKDDDTPQLVLQKTKANCWLMRPVPRRISTTRLI
ncbi:hypothetical protein PITCH_A470012 [uncultured Desulfobacterium sp.]|uniref:Uncharacterized protein n=1 Tax=uncultured Desulfobacterium sp. TaxID=201089 RepID=A0A445N0H6_9BACT|nr:hypothetical protein PITCH_A470012 [uncultured Desulfobacterium sp.]